MKLLKYLPAIFLMSTAIHAAPTASSTATITNWPHAQVMTLVTLISHHHYFLSNDTAENKSFHIKSELCPGDQIDRCVTKNEDVVLGQGQTANKDYDLKTTIVFRRTGDHSVVALTQVDGAAHHASEDQKYVFIYQ